MEPMNRMKLGGKLLAGGAIIDLLLKLQSVFSANEVFPLANRIVTFIFGLRISVLILPVKVEGTIINIPWTNLIWLPWTGVFIIFLLLVALKVLKGQFNSKLVALPVLSIMWGWFILGFLYSIYYSITNLSRYYDYDLIWIISELVSDVSVILMIVGLSHIIFNYKKITSDTFSEASQGGEMTLSQILFSFEGRINRAKFWLYQVLFLNLIFIICIAVGVMTQKGDDGLIAGYIIGLIINAWPSLAIGVKRSHDRNRSGFFVLVSLIPFLNIWYAVEVLFLPGTDGNNDYGPNPLSQYPSDRKITTASEDDQIKQNGNE